MLSVPIQHDLKQTAMQELVAAKLPRLHQHLQSIGCDMTIIGATDWILCLYTTSLPAEVRHIDIECRIPF